MPHPAPPLAAPRPDALARGARRAMACAPALPALMLAAWLGAGPAAAQSAPPLTYAQPLAPAATARVQERLRDLGAYQGRVDGIWGPESQQALERFQQGRGLQVTGALNQATVATLGLDPAALVGERSGAPAPGPAAGAGGGGDPLGGEAVRNVQARLRSLGFYREGIDGVWGPATQEALQRFQQGRGLQANGQINPATLSALGLDPAAPAAPPR